MAKIVIEQLTCQERILEAASSVFLASGFEKTSTAEIARVAKVSKRELYSHFADKRTLLAACVQDLQGHMGEQMDDTWALQAPLEEVLMASAKVLQNFILSERFGKLFRIVAAETYHSPGIAQQFFDTGPAQGRTATARYFKDQMAKGRLRKANPDAAANDFLDLVVGANSLTAVILGQTEAAKNKARRIRHAVDAFLMIYAPINGNEAVDEARLTRK